MAGSDADGVKSPPRPKFKKPAWLIKKQAAAAAAQANPSPKQDDDAVDIFSRSADTHAQIVAEQEEHERRLKEKKERKQRERKEKEKLRQQRFFERTFGTEIEKTSQVVDRESKRRRISTPDEDIDHVHPNSFSPALRQSRDRSPRGSQAAPIVVDLDDEEDSHDAVHSPEVATTAADIQESTDMEPDVTILSECNQQAGAASASHQAVIPDIAEDEGPNPVLNILIVPDIPDTMPVIVQRKYLQNLKDVRLAWCDYNNLDEEVKSAVVLTWRDRRLYDVQNCKSLGIPLDRHGFPYLMTEDRIQEPLDQLALVATTKIIIEEQKKAAAEKAEAAKRAADADSDGPKKPAVRTFRVILRSKNYSDHKLMLKEETLIEKVVNAFRRHHSIAEDKSVTISFDGESLSPTDAVKDTEMIEDYEGEAILLEVHVK